jgi:hypothetical protein
MEVPPFPRMMLASTAQRMQMEERLAPAEQAAQSLTMAGPLRVAAAEARSVAVVLVEAS